jgi:STE24 endopeptidase
LATNSTESQEYERAKEYSRWRITYFVIGIIYSWITSALFLFSGRSRDLARSGQRRAKNERAAEGLTVVAFVLLSWIVSLPLAYMRGFRLEHHYELSNHTRTSWLTDQLKGLGLQLVLMVPVTQVSLAIIRRRPRDWWAVLSAMAVPFTVLLVHLFPVLIAPIFNTYRPLRDEELGERLKALAAKSGIHVADIMEVDMSRQTKAPNAFFTGLGSSKRIVLSDTLLEEFTPDEIETIVAHEMGHQAHGDLWRLLALGTITTAGIALVTQRGFETLHPRTRSRTGIRGAGYVEAFPMLSLIGSFAGMLIMPLQNAYSRYIERQADAYALELTNNPRAFASALDRLREKALADPDPSRLEEILLHSHPTLRDRIESCHQYEREHLSA